MKDNVCKNRFPDYTPSRSKEYSFRQASCVKKKPSKKMLAREDIKKALENLALEGFVPLDDSYMTILRNLDPKTLKPKLVDFVLDLGEAALVYHCTSECLRKFCKDPMPAYQKAFSLVKEWRQNHQLPEDTQNVFNPIVAATLLHQALDFFQ